MFTVDTTQTEAKRGVKSYENFAFLKGIASLVISLEVTTEHLISAESVLICIMKHANSKDARKGSDAKKLKTDN